VVSQKAQGSVSLAKYSRVEAVAPSVVAEMKTLRKIPKVSFVLFAPIVYPDEREAMYPLCTFTSQDSADRIIRLTYSDLSRQEQPTSHHSPHEEERMVQDIKSVRMIQNQVKQNTIAMVKAGARLTRFPELHSTIAICSTCQHIVKREFTSLFLLHAVLSVAAPKEWYDDLTKMNQSGCDQIYNDNAKFRDAKGSQGIAKERADMTATMTSALYCDLASSDGLEGRSKGSDNYLKLSPKVPWISWCQSIVHGLDEIASLSRSALDAHSLFNHPAFNGVEIKEADFIIAAQLVDDLGKKSGSWRPLKVSADNDDPAVKKGVMVI